MPVINVRITNINGNRNEKAKIKDNIEIKSNFRIVSTKMEKDNSGENLLRVNFSFDVQYKPNVGDIELKGYLWYKSPDLNKLVKESDDKITLEPDVIKEISTVILRESLLESSMIARKLRLPVPIRLPEITAKFQATEFAKAS